MNSVVQIAKEIIRESRRVSRIVTIEELFEQPSSKIAMSVGQLLETTSKKSLKYVDGCEATHKRHNDKIGRWMFSVKCGESWSQGPYNVRFRLLKVKKKTKVRGIMGREIEVSCNCNAWRYNGADYNAQNKEYGERQYSDGSAPNIRDKKRKFLICKHVAASVPLFKKFVLPEGFKR